MDDDIQFIDAENYTGGQKDQLTFKEIMMRHIVKLSGLASKEFCGGYWQDRTKVIGGMGMTDHYYVGDSREEYSNSIDFLHDMLSPYFDEEMKQASEDNLKKIDQAFKECHYQDKNGEEQFNKQQYRNEKVKIKRELLRALSGFLLREKYLSSKIFEEEV